MPPPDGLYAVIINTESVFIILFLFFLHHSVVWSLSALIADLLFNTRRNENHPYNSHIQNSLVMIRYPVQHTQTHKTDWLVGYDWEWWCLMVYSAFASYLRGRCANTTPHNDAEGVFIAWKSVYVRRTDSGVGSFVLCIKWCTTPTRPPEAVKLLIWLEHIVVNLLSFTYFAGCANSRMYL